MIFEKKNSLCREALRVLNKIFPKASEVEGVLFVPCVYIFAGKNDRDVYVPDESKYQTVKVWYSGRDRIDLEGLTGKQVVALINRFAENPRVKAYLVCGGSYLRMRYYPAT